MKTCISCKQTRDWIAFYRNRTIKDGYEPLCKLCYNQRKKAYVTKLSPHELPQQKVCSVCRSSKDLEKFSKSSEKKDGRHSYCRDCMREKNRQYREKNPHLKIRNRLSARLFILSLTDEQRKARQRAYYHANKQRIIEQRRAKRNASSSSAKV